MLEYKSCTVQFMLQPKENPCTIQNSLKDKCFIIHVKKTIRHLMSLHLFKFTLH